MAKKRTGALRTALYSGAFGLVIGLLVIFVGIVNIVTAAKAEPREPSDEQKAEAAFMVMAREDWVFKKRDPNHIRGRIAVVQAQTGDLENTLTRIEDTKLKQDVVRNVAVYEYLHQKVGPIEKPTLEVIKPAKDIADKIQDALLKADALRRVGEVQLRADPAVAKVTLQEAEKIVPTAPAPPLYTPPPLFNPMMLIWPAGLAIFGLVLGFLLKEVIAGFGSSGRNKATAEEEEEDDEEEEEEKAQVPAPMAEAPMAEAPMAEAPMAETPVVDVPVDAPMAEAPMAAEIPMEPLVEPPPLVPPPPAPAPSQLARAAAQQPVAAVGSDAKKTMMARQGAAQPTMLAKKGPAVPTQLAKATAAATKMADTQEPMKLPEKGKTQTK